MCAFSNNCLLITLRPTDQQHDLRQFRPQRTPRHTCRPELVRLAPIRSNLLSCAPLYTAVESIEDQRHLAVVIILAVLVVVVALVGIITLSELFCAEHNRPSRSSLYNCLGMFLFSGVVVLVLGTSGCSIDMVRAHCL